MKILLINPSYHRVYSRVASAEGINPPLGIACVAAYLKQGGHKVTVLDLNAENMPQERLSTFIAQGFQLVGTTALTPSINIALDIVKSIKNKFPRLKTVLGGVHITVIGKKILEEVSELDFGIIGEGEETALELANALESDSTITNIRGLIFRKGKEVIQNETRPLIRDLDTLPFPAYELLPMGRYRMHIHHTGFGKKIPPGPFSLIFTSRGCPFNCSFCASTTVWGRGVRYRGVENVVREIEMLHREFGVKVFSIVDDIFTLDKKRLFSILDGIRNKRIDIHFNCLSRVDTITEDMLKRLKDSGCYMLRYGVESGSQEILHRMHKGITLEQIEKAFDMTNKCGIATSATFIVGHPGETRETVFETIKLAKKIRATLVHFFPLIPYPGTDVYELAKSENLLCEDGNWKEWHFFSKKYVLRTKDLNPLELICLKKKALRDVYLDISFIWMSLRKIKSWDQLKRYLLGLKAVLSLILKK